MRAQFSRCCLFGLLLWAATVTDVSAQAPSKAPEPARAAPGKTDYHGGLVSPPLPKPKFTLTDTSGTAFDFDADTRGYVTFLFFGYTHCPDMCPLQMYMIADALRKLPPATAGQFKVVFVTTDPARRRYCACTSIALISVSLASREAKKPSRRHKWLPIFHRLRKGPCDQMATMKWAIRHLSWPTPKTIWRT